MKRLLKIEAKWQVIFNDFGKKSMGRWSYSDRTEADSLKRVSVYWLKKNGYFRDSYVFGGIKWTNKWSEESSIGLDCNITEEEKYIRLHYNQTDNEGKQNNFDYRVKLVTTPCHFGGFRYWFLCPCTVNEKYCGRRVGVLYKAGDYFACRHCYNLTYSSRNASGVFRYGGNVSFPELEEMRAKIKRLTYKGKLTRKYRSYIKKENKLTLGMAMAVNMIERRRGKK